jgi:hypothetical protein
LRLHPVVVCVVVSSDCCRCCCCLLGYADGSGAPPSSENLSSVTGGVRSYMAGATEAEKTEKKGQQVGADVISLVDVLSSRGLHV